MVKRERKGKKTGSYRYKRYRDELDFLQYVMLQNNRDILHSISSCRSLLTQGGVS